MLFWLFVIIGVAALISALVIDAFSPDEDELAEMRNAALDSWSMALRLHQHPKKVHELQDAYYAADDKLNEYRRSKRTKERVCNGFSITLYVIAGIMAFAILISSIVLLFSYATAGGERAMLEAEYETLCWEVENQVYNDGGDDVVGKKELYNQVREWNKDLARNQYYEKNFWVGIFYPDIYGDLKLIELK